MLELKNATLVSAGRTLFSNLSLIAQEGTMLCVTGAPGSGKTQLARVMLGFVPLTSGFVSIDGELLTPLSARALRKLMGYIPAETADRTTGRTIDRTVQAVMPAVNDLEAVWAPGVFPSGYIGYPEDRALTGFSKAFGLSAAFGVPRSSGTSVLPPLSSKQIIIADDPAPSLFATLNQLSAGGRVVIVMSRRAEYLSAAQQLITLEPPLHLTP